MHGRCPRGCTLPTRRGPPAPAPASYMCSNGQCGGAGSAGVGTEPASSMHVGRRGAVPGRVGWPSSASLPFTYWSTGSGNGRRLFLTSLVTRHRCSGPAEASQAPAPRSATASSSNDPTRPTSPKPPKRSSSTGIDNCSWVDLAGLYGSSTAIAQVPTAVAIGYARLVLHACSSLSLAWITAFQAGADDEQLSMHLLPQARLRRLAPRQREWGGLRPDHVVTSSSLGGAISPVRRRP